MDIEAPTSDPVSLPRPIKSKIKSLLPIIGLVLILPVIVGAVKLQQRLSSQAASPGPANVLISPILTPGGGVSAGTFGLAIDPGYSQTIYMSAQAVDEQGSPVSSPVTYMWGYSSTDSIGNFVPDPNQPIASFTPSETNYGLGDIWIRAVNSYGTATGSIKVCVGVPCPIIPTSTPTPTPTPTPASSPTPTPTPVPSPTPKPSPTPLLPNLTIINGISVEPKSIPVSGKTLVSFRLANRGTANASTAPYAFTNQADGYSQPAPSNTCTASTTLKPYEECVAAYNFSFKTTGSKTLNVQLDPDNIIAESEENDNYYTTYVEVLADQPPIIQTKALPTAKQFRLYVANVVARSPINSEKVIINISGLPLGLFYSCSIKGPVTTCKIYGSVIYHSPSGYPIAITATDSRGASTSTVLQLMTKPWGKGK